MATLLIDKYLEKGICLIFAEMQKPCFSRIVQISGLSYSTSKNLTLSCAEIRRKKICLILQNCRNFVWNFDIFHVKNVEERNMLVFCRIIIETMHIIFACLFFLQDKLLFSRNGKDTESNIYVKKIKKKWPNFLFFPECLWSSVCF